GRGRCEGVKEDTAWRRARGLFAALALKRAVLYKRGFPTLGAQPFAPNVPQPPGENSMAVPKRKTSPARGGVGRAADALSRPTYVEDKDSGELRRPHHIDLKTGMYRGRPVLKSRKEA